ncbi:MAG: deoxyribodipyrimidine photo-lyase [Pseudomonadota bacterium]
MIKGPTIVWFRQDLRLADNPALVRAAKTGAPVLALYVLDDETEGPWRLGGASRWWLHHSLAALDRELRQLGTQLILRRGAADRVVMDLVDEVDAVSVTWNRCYEPAARDRDARLKAALKARGIDVTSHKSALLFEPWSVSTQDDKPYRVFTPFWRACLNLPEPAAPEKVPSRLTGPADHPASDAIENWALLPTAPDWTGGLRETWQPGEAGAAARLDAFLDGAIDGYGKLRNRPDIDGTSRLSPHLHFGEIGPRQVWHAVKARLANDGPSSTESSAWSFLRELGWREFSYNLLYHFPRLPTEPLDQRFADFPWGARNDAALSAWQRGLTGYPIVDAGMRQLYAIGWMHNRVRMIVASFLIKDLMIPWQQGEAWFWDTLVDADLANNAASWQWVAGCGADAAPYFRVFNPVLQGEKFDADGTYVRRWVPELSSLPNRYIHKPWEAPADVLMAADVTLGETYPLPLVNHADARKAALNAYETVKASA